MGSGPTGVACLNTGRNFIGIDDEFDHFEIACERMDKAWGDDMKTMPKEGRVRPKYILNY